MARVHIPLELAGAALFVIIFREEGSILGLPDSVAGYRL